MSAYKEAAVLVIEALTSMPGFEWDDDDLADCAQAAVKALEAGGWVPVAGSSKAEPRHERPAGRGGK